MSSISIFPIEVLEWITNVVTTSQQMRLWQCGDRILNIKLKNGGLKRTSLCWSGGTWMPWPRSYFTTFDGIVDVEWSVSIGTLLCPTLELNLLPKTLKRLHLACEDAFILLRQQNVNMDAMLPLLESLYLSGGHLREENLKNLPSNLIELNVASRGGNIKSSRIFGDLPRHIVRLTLGFNILDESELENDLPSQLISLKIYGLECNFNWFSKLPKSLKTIEIAWRELHRFYHVVPLPPQLGVLKCPFLSKFSKSTLSRLPPTLKCLEAHIRDINPGDVILPLLPKNLTRFELKSGQIDLVEQLPASLTDFDAIVSATRPDILSFYRPESITIRIGNGPFSDKLNIIAFPTKLQHLQLDYINDEICAMLPHALLSLRIERGLITIKGASKLPKSLTSLAICFGVLDDNPAMSYLRHVANIELKFEKEISMSKLDEHWISSLLPSSSPTSSHHNAHLTSLTVHHQPDPYGEFLLCPYIQKPFFDALAQFINLRKLIVLFFKNISSDWLCGIPQSVTELEIRHLTDFPTASVLRSLPVSLQSLVLEFEKKEGKECDWHDETLQSLPRTLQHFRIYGASPNLTNRMYEYLPPNLQISSLRSTDSFGSRSNFVPPLDRLYEKS